MKNRAAGVTSILRIDKNASRVPSRRLVFVLIAMILVLLQFVDFPKRPIISWIPTTGIIVIGALVWGIGVVHLFRREISASQIYCDGRSLRFTGDDEKLLFEGRWCKFEGVIASPSSKGVGLSACPYQYILHFGEDGEYAVTKEFGERLVEWIADQFGNDHPLLLAAEKDEFERQEISGLEKPCPSIIALVYTVVGIVCLVASVLAWSKRAGLGWLDYIEPAVFLFQAFVAFCGTTWFFVKYRRQHARLSEYIERNDGDACKSTSGALRAIQKERLSRVGQLQAERHLPPLIGIAGCITLLGTAVAEGGMHWLMLGVGGIVLLVAGLFPFVGLRHEFYLEYLTAQLEEKHWEASK